MSINSDYINHINVSTNIQPAETLDAVDLKVSALKRHISEESSPMLSPKKLRLESHLPAETPAETVYNPLMDMDCELFPELRVIHDSESDFASFPPSLASEKTSSKPQNMDIDCELFPELRGIDDSESDFASSPPSLASEKTSSKPKNYVPKRYHPVIKVIENLIEAEDKMKPYTDVEISKEVEDICGFPIDYRYVINIRQALNIPKSSFRKIMNYDPTGELIQKELLIPKNKISDPAARKAIQSMIEEEDKSMPLTDRDISKKIEAVCGYPITHRTVINLRKKLLIPDASERQLSYRDADGKMIPRKTRKIKRNINHPALEAIKNVIADEDKKNPFTDFEISKKIKRLHGISLSKSRIGSLRNKLNIPNSLARII
ncbi:MAG: hypothetical protein ACK5MA_08140 [Parachlamydiaceae bacterium]